MTDSTDLLSTVRQLLADAGLYRPESPARGLVVSTVGDTVVVGWAATAPVPAARTAFAIRTAVVELLTAGGLNAVYRRVPGQSSGTVTVTAPGAQPSRAEPLPAAS